MVNKKILMSVLILGMAATVAGAGTWAYFTDTATSTDNQFTAGTLKLEVGNESSLENFTVSNIKPGDTDIAAGIIEVKNIGSINGTVKAEITNVSNSGFADLLNLTVNNEKKALADGSEWDLGSLESQQSKKITFYYTWVSNEPSIDNSYQDESVTFDVKFEITQESY